MPKGTANTPRNYGQKTVGTKLVLLGDTGMRTGKSSIIRRYVENTFSDRRLNIGVDFFFKHTKGKVINDIKLQIWDTSGRERGISTLVYSRGSHIAFVVFDVTQRNTFERVAKYEKVMELTKDQQCCIAIVGNKIDLKDKREVSTKEGRELADFWGVSYFEVSAKEGTGVFEMFDDMISRAEDVCVKAGRHLEKIPSEKDCTTSENYGSFFSTIQSWFGLNK
mmetsp:Transcript_17100/g.19064  ORF Transcript_17100/g.19064 Transcript_17100/m.19064 type:complete len:222 (-) Transcript_17100:38-703(-)